MSARLASGARDLIATNLLANLLGLASGVCMARGLGAEGRGTYQIALLYWGLCPGLLTLSLGTMLAARPEPSLQRGWFLRQAGFFTAAGCLLAAVLPALTSLDGRQALLLAAGAPGFMTTDLVAGRLRQRGDFRNLAVFRLVDTGGGAALIVGLFASGLLTVDSAIAALTGSTILAVLAVSLRLNLSRHHVPIRLPLRQVVTVHSATVLRILATQGDLVLVAVLLGQADLGRYAVAASLAAQFGILPAAIAPVMFRSDLRSDGSTKHAEAALQLLGLLAGLGAVACLLLGPSFFTNVFGPGFRDAGAVASLLVVSAGLAGMVLVLEAVAVARGYPSLTLTSRLQSIPILMLFAVLLVKWPDPRVAALGPVATNACSLTILLRTSTSLGLLDVRRLLKPRTLSKSVRSTMSRGLSP